MSVSASASRLGAADGAPALARPRRTRPVAFWMLLAFFVFEYIRPPLIVMLKPQMICLVLFIVLWLRDPQRPRPWSRNLTLQTVFLGLCAVSVFFASNYFSAYIVTRTMYGHVVIALAITWLLVNRRDFVLAIWFWVGIMGFQAFYALTHAGQGMGNVLGDENDLALGVNTAIPFALVGVRTFRGGKRVACLALLVLLVAGVVASISRGGFVGLVALALYCTFTGRHRMRNLALGLAAALLFFLAIPSSYKREVNSIQETESGTAETRLFFWQAATNMWKAYPVLGVGAGNSIWNVGRFQPDGTDSGLFSGRQYHERDFTMQAVHSAYFQLLSEMGTVGVVVVGAILWGHFSGLRQLRRRVSRNSRSSPKLRADTDLYTVALGGAMVGYLAAGAFLSVAYYPYLWYFSAFAVAWARVAESQLDGNGRPRKAPSVRPPRAAPEPRLADLLRVRPTEGGSATGRTSPR